MKYLIVTVKKEKKISLKIHISGPHPKNITLAVILINNIFLYSAKARRAKPTPPNSTIYPATNSDSPSTKSNGARFVSAKTQIIHNQNTSTPTITDKKSFLRQSLNL